MSVIAITLLSLLADVPFAPADLSCLDDESLVALDAAWERALLEADAQFLQASLADDFVWVHDHASAIDSKEGLIGWASENRGNSGMRSRVQSDVETRRLGGTAVVMGYTVVSRESGSTRYRFMRTYASDAGECLLLANQTMAIPDNSEER